MTGNRIRVLLIEDEPADADYIRELLSEQVPPRPTPILITGETDVGKELFVDAIHSLSGRKGKLVKVNIAGLDDNMFTDTLFGHLKGAFTDAHKERAGLVEQTQVRQAGDEHIHILYG